MQKVGTQYSDLYPENQDEESHLPDIVVGRVGSSLEHHYWLPYDFGMMERKGTNNNSAAAAKID